MKKIFFFTLLIICILQLGLGILFGKEKINYHVDEIYTFGLSNNTTGTTIKVPQGKLIDRSVLDSYVSVDFNHRFDYANVWANQTADVHPPFYYLLIHTICSFIPGKFLPMGGIGLNIISSILVTLLIYFLVTELTKNELISLLTCIAWAFSLGNMTFVVFIRMYMVLTVFILAITLLHLYYLNKQLKIKFYIGVLILSIFGALTQYYFLIYLFFLSLLFGIQLLWSKQYRSALFYILSLSGAGIASIEIFPAILKHIFGGYRGTESFQNIADSSDIFERYQQYFLIISKELFHNHLLEILIFILLLTLLFLLKNKRELKWKNTILSGYSLISFPCIFYFLIVGKISVFITDRYMMPIFPLILIIVVLAVTFLSSKILPIKQITIIEACFFILLSAMGLGKNYNINYLYQETAPAIEYAQKHKDSDVLVIYTGAWRLNAAYAELIQYNHLTMISKKKLDKFNSTVSNYSNSIVYIIGDNPQDTLTKIMDMNPNWHTYTLELTSQYTNVYKLSK